MIPRPPRSTPSRSSAASDVYKRQEYFEAAGLALVRERTGLPAPLAEEHPAYLLVEIAGPEEYRANYEERTGALPELQAASAALDDPSRAALWAYRERHTESVSYTHLRA